MPLKRLYLPTTLNIVIKQ